MPVIPGACRDFVRGGFRQERGESNTPDVSVPDLIDFRHACGSLRKACTHESIDALIHGFVTAEQPFLWEEVSVGAQDW